MNILITGINSVLGAQLAKSLQNKGHHVLGLYNVNQSNIPNGILSLQFNDTQVASFNPSIVFLLGAFVPRGSYNTRDERFQTHNVDAISSLILLFPKARFVLASSVAVYGDETGIINEKSEFKNTSLYGLSKLAGEKIIGKTESWIALRFSSIYGKQINAVNFINRAIIQAKSTGEITLFGDGERKQNYVYLNDAVELLISAGFSNKNGVFLGTSSCSISNKEIAEIIAKHVLGTKINYTGHDKSPSYQYDNSTTVKMLNFSLETSIQQGIEEILFE